MKKIDLGQTLSILANLGVIAGIALLAFELNQNQALGKAQARNEIARADHELTMFEYENGLDEFRRRMADGDDSQEVNDAIGVWMALWFRHYQNLHYQYRQGLFDDDEFEPFMTELMGYINGEDGIRSRYCNARVIMSSSFVSEVDSRLSTPCE